MLIKHSDISLRQSKWDAGQIMRFAGCWNDMSEKVFNDFLKEISQRRKQAFSRRRSDEACNG